jgi:signal transduction histidine kinase
MLAEAADAFFTSARRLPAPGFVAFWRTDRAVIVAEESLQRRLTKAAETGIEPALQLRPRGYAPAALSALRPLADPELPWIVEAAPRDPAALERSLRNREMLYLAALALVLTALASGVYLTARAVRREMETARLQSDFVATVSHEFRSPLTGIRQLAELLDAGVVTDEARRREYFGLILNESGRLSRLVENILDFSRLEAGRKQYRMESIDTSAWLKDIAAALRNPRLTLDVPDGLPPAYGDRDALISVVANLLDNAFKYSPPEQPVTLRAGSANGAVTVSVTDRGPGIPPQEQQRVFDRFYRGAGELAENVKGAGIGLSLVKRIIEDHGGSVALDSRPGEGSTFTISLKSGALG